MGNGSIPLLPHPPITHCLILLSFWKNRRTAKNRRDGSCRFLLGSGAFMFWLCLAEGKQFVQFFYNALLFGEWRERKAQRCYFMRF